MRVLLVSSHYPPAHSGGAERCVRALAHSLRDAGHTVEVAAPVASFDDSGVIVRTLPRTRPRAAQKLIFDYVSPGANAALDSVMDNFAPDVVHVHNVYGIGSALIARAAGRAATVVTLHDYWPMDVSSPAYHAGALRYPTRPWLRAWTPVHRALHRRHLRRASVVAPSRFLAQRVGRALDIEVDVIPNGVSRPEMAASRGPSMLYAGRLVSEKGIDLALPAMVAAVRGSAWTVDVAGEGPLRKTLARSYPGVRWHGRVDPLPLYARSSSVVVPSIWPENAPLVVLEAMSHGLAVVAAASGGIPEYVRDGETGLLFRPGDGAALEAQLRRLVAQPSLVRSLGDAARAAAATYSWESARSGYEGLYAQLTSIDGHRTTESPGGAACTRPATI